MEAIKFFRFPYQAGDAIQNMHDVYDIKETFDKYYIVDTTEPLSRYEVIYSAVKNAQNIHARKTISMTVRSKEDRAENQTLPILILVYFLDRLYLY